MPSGDAVCEPEASSDDRVIEYPNWQEGKIGHIESEPRDVQHQRNLQNASNEHDHPEPRILSEAPMDSPRGYDQRRAEVYPGR